MARVQILGPKALLDECVKVLHDAAVVHIESAPVEPGPEGEFMARAPIEKDKIEKKLALEKAAEGIKNLLALLSPPVSWSKPVVQGSAIEGLLEELAPVDKKVRSLRARRERLLEELSALGRYEKLFMGFAPLVSRLGGLKNLDIMGLTVEKRREDVVKLLEDEVAKLTSGSYRIYVKELDDTTIGIVLAYPRQYDIKIRNLLAGKEISEVRLPDEYEDMTLYAAIRSMRKKMDALPAAIRDVEAEIDAISRLWYPTLVALREAVGDALDEIGVLDYARQSHFAFVIEGWAPTESLDTLRRTLADSFGGRVTVREMVVEGREARRVPVQIRNPWFIRPFEVFLGALPSPIYGSVDPTIYVALFFPAFWGLIVGDVGYGAVLLTLALVLRHRLKDKPVFRDLFTVLAVSSVSAIIFGVLFGEFFGDLGEELGILHPIILNRLDSIKALAVVTIAIGVGHVLLGVVIGVVNHIMRGKMKEAGARAAYFVSIVSLLVLLAIMLEFVPSGFMTPVAITLLVSFVVLTVLEGILGPLELLKAMGNILSYLRIMAVGMASVVMALVANRIGELSENIVVGIIAAAMIHMLNLAISLLSPSIQSMRLQYVEFFSKFYEGGGRKYHPFRKR